MDSNFTEYKRKPELSIYETLASICGKALVDFEEIGPDDYYVLKSGKDARANDGVYCVRIVFGRSEKIKRGKIKHDMDGDTYRSEEIVKVDGYYTYPEYSQNMGKKLISERLFKKLTDYTFNNADKRVAANSWRGRMAAALEAKRRVKLRIGDVLRIAPHISIGDEKRGVMPRRISEIKCISVNPLRFAEVVIRGCSEEYDGSHYIPRTEIAKRNFEYLDRGKPNRSRKCDPKFDEAGHLAKLAAAIEQYGNLLPEAPTKPPRKKRTAPIGIDNRELTLEEKISLRAKETEDGKKRYDWGMYNQGAEKLAGERSKVRFESGYDTHGNRVSIRVNNDGSRDYEIVDYDPEGYGM